MNILKTLTVLVTVVMLTACSKNEQPNNAPNAFTVKVEKHVDGDTIRVSWTEAADPDGDTVTYSVYLNGTLVEENITGLALYSIKFSQLATGDNTIKVVAKDSKNATTEVSEIYTKVVRIDVEA